MKRLNKKYLWLGLVILVLALAIGVFVSKRAQQSHMNHQGHAHTKSAKAELYHCPMHPDVTSDKPGKCPICHMDLVKVDEDSDGSEAMKPSEDQAATGKETGERKLLFYRHPMQPEITSKTPDKDSMGMDYIPVYSDEIEDQAQGKGEVSGRAGFSLSPEKQQLIGVASVQVSRQKLSHEIRATGRVAFDPELFATIDEYRQALTARSQIEDSSYSGFKDQTNALVASSKTKLKLMGLTDNQIQKIGRGGSNSMNLLLPDGRVWVYAEVFEYEVGGLKPGQKIEAEAPSIPGEVFKGTVSSISPVLNAPTRTIRVRAEVPDPKRILRPDTFLNVRILSDLGEKLAIPEDSVLHTGTQAYVFVFQNQGRFDPRAVKLGAKAGNLYEVIEGLKEGERVITGANFLIDSESRLKGVLNKKAPSASGGNQ